MEAYSILGNSFGGSLIFTPSKRRIFSLKDALRYHIGIVRERNDVKVISPIDKYNYCLPCYEAFMAFGIKEEYLTRGIIKDSRTKARLELLLEILFK